MIYWVDHILLGVKVNALNPLLVLHNLNLPILVALLQAPDLLPAGEEQLDGTGLCLAHPAVLVCEAEAIATRAGKRSIEVGAHVGASVHGGIFALIVVLALLWIFGISDVASLAVADVSALQEVPTQVLAASTHVLLVVRTLPNVVATGLV